MFHRADANLANNNILIHKYSEVDQANAIKAIHGAIKSGINYIDTAPWYGQGKSEEIYGL